MVAIVAMIIGYLIWGDLRVAFYMMLGFVMAKWLVDSINKNNRK